jgi:hypothetical protein
LTCASNFASVEHAKEVEMSQPCTVEMNGERYSQHIQKAVLKNMPELFFQISMDQIWRKGGWLYILSRVDANWITELHLRLGVFTQAYSDAEDGRCMNLAMNEANLLSEHPDKYTSRECRPDRPDLCGSAIRTRSPDMILAFAGFPDMLSETLLLISGYDADMISRTEVHDITAAAPSILKLWNELRSPR